VSQRKRTYKNIAISGIFTYLNQGINLIAMIALARLLTPSDYGTFALIGVFTSLIGIFQENGILQAVIRGNNQDANYAEKFNTLSLLSGVTSALVIWILAIPIGLFYSNNSLILPSLAIGFTFIFNSIILVPSAVLQQELKFQLIGKIQTISNLIALILCGIAAYYGLSYWSLVIRELAFTLIQLIILIKIKKIKFCLEFPELKKYFLSIKKLYLNITGSALINFFSRNTDNLLIGKIYGGEKLGIYNRAYTLIYLSINLVSGAFNQVLFPSLKTQDEASIAKEYFLSTNIIAFLLFPLMLLFNVFPSGITLLIWGHKWMEVSYLLPYIGILIFIQCQLNINSNVYFLFRQEKYIIWVTLINTVIAVASIIMGALSSFTDVLKYYTLFYIGISALVTIYVVSHLILPNSIISNLKFWLPKLAIIWIAFLLTSLHEQNNYWAWLFLSLAFYFHIFIQEKHLMYSILSKLKDRITKKISF
jgi:O-antigen/teichoic acid export membrane protein